MVLTIPLNVLAIPLLCAKRLNVRTRDGKIHHNRGGRGRAGDFPARSLVTGRGWRGTAFGGARGRTDVPKIVDWYMQGKIDIDPMITHTLALEDINKGFDLMHAGESIRSVVVF